MILVRKTHLFTVLSLIILCFSFSIGFGIYTNFSTNHVSFLALGDSYTIGEGVSREESWPILLQSELQGRKIIIDPLEIIAKTGWETTDLLQNIRTNRQYSVVTILIGVNDQFRGRSIQSYANNFIQILETGIDLAMGDSNRVIVISIPDYSVTPKIAPSARLSISEQLEAFNEENRILADEYGVRYVNITDLSRLASADLGLLAQDQLHPSARMYELWVERLVPQVLEII
jgi:lysophospholipase L1-like esterase